MGGLMGGAVAVDRCDEFAAIGIYMELVKFGDGCAVLGSTP